MPAWFDQDDMPAESEPVHESAQPCSCDMGCKPKPHFCEQHRFWRGARRMSQTPGPNRHRLTPVQRRVLAFMFAAEQPVVFETGHKTTEFVNGFIVRCQSLVWYFLKAHGYIHKSNVGTCRWELTPTGVLAVGGCDVSPTMTHIVGTAGSCAFCKRKVARDLEN